MSKIPRHFESVLNCKKQVKSINRVIGKISSVLHSQQKNITGDLKYYIIGATAQHPATYFL